MQVVLLLLLLLLTGMCQAAWFEEDVYKGSKRVVEDDDSVSSEQRKGLLSVLLNLDKLYESSVTVNGQVNSAESFDNGHQPRAPSSQAAKGDFAYDEEDASLLKSVLEGIKSRPSKRARYDVSGVLPPMAELCRVMQMRGCSHSRHK